MDYSAGLKNELRKIHKEINKTFSCTKTESLFMYFVDLMQGFKHNK